MSDPMKVRAVITLRGQMFEIETGGDWGGGNEPGAVLDVVEALKKMKLAALITFHETLLVEQESHPALRDGGAEDALCRPILAENANPPEVDGALGAMLRVRAIAKEDRHMYQKGN